MCCVTLALACVCSSALASDTLDERSAVQQIAEKYEGAVEVRLWDNTRCDLLSATHAYEVDWAYNYAEGVGQAVYYGTLTDRKPGLILLVRDIQQEQRFIYRAQIACKAAGVDLFVEQVREPARSKPVIGQQNPLAAEDDPVYVYFIHDPDNDKYFKKGALGLSGWGEITEAEVWTVKKTAERVLAGMYGSRANRCVIKKFLILPAKE